MAVSSSLRKCRSQLLTRLLTQHKKLNALGKLRSEVALDCIVPGYFFCTLSCGGGVRGFGEVRQATSGVLTAAA